jgi:hypothetical protein
MSTNFDVFLQLLLKFQNLLSGVPQAGREPVHKNWVENIFFPEKRYFSKKKFNA